jgi:hypothetical protein
LKILISWKDVGYNDFINILWNKYFKDIKLKLYDEEWNINEENAKIFLTIFSKSKWEKLAIQWIWMMENYTKQLVENWIHILTKIKKYAFYKWENILPKVKLEVQL